MLKSAQLLMFIVLYMYLISFNFNYCVSEPLSPSLDSEATMEVDNDINSDGGQSMDEQDELSTSEDKLYFMEGPCTDMEKDDETIRAIR